MNRNRNVRPVKINTSSSTVGRCVAGIALVIYETQMARQTRRTRQNGSQTEQNRWVGLLSSRQGIEVICMSVLYKRSRLQSADTNLHLDYWLKQVVLWVSVEVLCVHRKETLPVQLIWDSEKCSRSTSLQRIIICWTPSGPGVGSRFKINFSFFIKKTKLCFSHKRQRIVQSITWWNKHFMNKKRIKHSTAVSSVAFQSS